MSRLFKTLPELGTRAALAALLALTPAAGVMAQDDAAQTEAEASETADTPIQDASESASDGPAVGETYTRETMKDWEVRCVYAGEDKNDPCTMYQLLEDSDGNSVAEITMFALSGEGEAAAGGTIIAPLQTYLPPGVAMMIPGAEGKRYPFTFCSEVGCYARVGFTDAEVAAFKAGVSVPMELRPLGAPEEVVELSVSLSGFTAAYDAVAKYNAGE